MLHMIVFLKYIMARFVSTVFEAYLNIICNSEKNKIQSFLFLDWLPNKDSRIQFVLAFS